MPVAADEVEMLVSEAGKPALVAAAYRQDSNGAWVLLLPAPKTGQRILCLGLGSSDFRAPLQYWHDDVDVVQSSRIPETVEHTRVQAGREPVIATLRWCPGQALPFAPGTFSGAVIRLAAGGVAEHSTLTSELVLGSALLREARRLLTSSGFLYLEVDNTWSVRNLGHLLRGRWGQLAIAPGRRFWLRALRAADFPQPAFHALLLERGELAEILPASGHALSQHAVGFRERLKAVLLGPRGALHFATAYGVMADAGNQPKLLDELLVTATMPSGERLPGSPNSSFQVGRIISTSEKAFVECLPTTPGLSSLFLVVPFSPGTVARRRREVAAMNQLKAAQLPITKFLPGTAREARCRGRPVFVYSALPGRAIDIPVPQLPTLTQHAFDLLVDFNRSSRGTSRVDADAFAACIGSGLAGALGRYPEAHVALGCLERALERCLLGRRVQTVWVHGDYKVENLLFDMQELRITGVIDWELASPKGLLAVDLLFLLAYNRVTRGEAMDVVDVIEQALLPGSWLKHEQELLDKYVGTFEISSSYMAVASAAFVIHHIGSRFSYTGPEGPRRRLPAIIMSLARRIEATEPLGDDG